VKSKREIGAYQQISLLCGTGQICDYLEIENIRANP